MPEYLKVLPFEVTKPKTWKSDATDKGVVVTDKLDGEHVIVREDQLYGRRKSDRGVYENKWGTLPLQLRLDLHSYLYHLAYHHSDCWVEGELLVEGGTSTDLKHCLLTESEHHRIKFVAFDLRSQPSVAVAR